VPDDEARGRAGPPGWVTRAALVVLAGYRRWLSPLLPGACRFWPTCSEYARLALLRHGLVRGGALALWRLCRCHRWARGGIDPPP
jgi:putative membrane protein insertion efficiency factor